jgi:hypothetical protein
MAAYLLDTLYRHSPHPSLEGGMGVGISSPRPSYVLYLTHHIEGKSKGGDYQIDLTLIGLKQLLGDSNVIDYPTRKIIYKGEEEFNTTGYAHSQSKLYGNGFTYGHTIADALQETQERSSERVKENIISNKYDLIIIGSAHLAAHCFQCSHREIPFFELICMHYDSWKVALLDGGDLPATTSLLKLFNFCARHLFSREGLYILLYLRLHLLIFE